MASGRKPSMLRISTRRALGRGDGLAIDVSVGVGVRVTVGGGRVGGTVLVWVGRGKSVAVSVGISGVGTGKHALSSSIINKIRAENFEQNSFFILLVVQSF